MDKNIVIRLGKLQDALRDVSLSLERLVDDAFDDGNETGYTEGRDELTKGGS